MDVYLHDFLTSALDVGEWSASSPGHFAPGERATDTHFDRRLGGLRTRSGYCSKKKKSHNCHYQYLNPDHLSRDLVFIQTDLSRLVFNK
jgi:hypothetical protein